jgi:hypothetical protein
MYRTICTNILRLLKECRLVVGMTALMTPLSAYCCILLQTLWRVSSRPTLLSPAKVITTHVHVNAMTELDRNTQKYAGEGSITA